MSKQTVIKDNQSVSLCWGNLKDEARPVKYAKLRNTAVQGELTTLALRICALLQRKRKKRKEKKNK